MDRGLEVQIDMNKTSDRHVYPPSEGLDVGTDVGFAVGADDKTGGEKSWNGLGDAKWI